MQDLKHHHHRDEFNGNVVFPHGTLDGNYVGQHIGDRDFLERVKEIGPRLYLLGLVHDNNGEFVQDGFHFIIAALGDDDEEPNLSARIH